MAGVGGKRRHDANRRAEGGRGSIEGKPLQQHRHWQCFPRNAARIGGF
jgi:hypothetical protein